MNVVLPLCVSYATHPDTNISYYGYYNAQRLRLQMIIIVIIGIGFDFKV